MGPSPILSITHVVTIGTMLNFNGGNRVPTWPEKPKKWERFFQLVNFEHIGKVRESHTKYWKTWGISDKCYLLFIGDI